MNEKNEERYVMLHTPYEPIKTEDLYVMYCGTQKCKSLHSHGPVIRNHFIIHFIQEGKGMLKINNNEYNLSKNQCFVIFPGYSHYYIADEYTPWTYKWIAFNGIKAEWYLNQANLSVSNPIFEYRLDDFSDEIINDELFSTKKYNMTKELKILGILYLVLSDVIETYKSNKIRHSEDLTAYYYTKIIEFIKINYTNNIMVQSIASYIGISRSYLYYIFKKYTKLSIHQFLIKYRIEMAIYLMSDKQLSISDISRSVGYDDPLQFSAIFKRIKGVSPREYRDKLNADKT